MNIVIIEDEEFAARRLERMIGEIDPEIQVVSKLESVGDSVEWFQNNPEPELIFMDIHLEDNLSFAIFDNVSISCPIVFTTATDETSTHAFKLKKIDYLLKPIDQVELVKVIEKYSKLPKGDDRIVDAAFFTEIIRKPKSFKSGT
jgi:DNA-binding LytR/AlgR family response regulator